MTNQKTSYIYGLHAVESALRNDAGNIACIHYSHERHDKRITRLIELAAAKNRTTQPCTRSELNRLANSSKHQGVVAQYHAISQGSENELDTLLATQAEPAFLLVLDGVQDPHNLGACLRSAEAAGVHAVIIPKDKAATVTPVVRKVAAGAAERLPIIRATNLARVLKQLKKAGIWVVGTSDKAETDIFQVDLNGPLALVMGSEGKGIRPLVMQHCDTLAHIPMQGGAESLNVSVATGVCLFEALRQRRLKASLLHRNT